MDNGANNAGRLRESATYKCPNCGGTVQYAIKERKFLCTSCRCEYSVQTKQTVDEYDFNQYAARAAAQQPLTGVTTIECASCGGEIYFNEHETARRCPMCGSANVRTQVATTGIAPEGIVPFRIDAYDAQEKFRIWIKKRWFAPNLLKKAYAEGNLQGIYVPFWTFDAYAQANYQGQGGRTRTRTTRDGKTETYTDWFPTSGSVQRSFDDILVCASQNQTGSNIRRVLPYNTISDINPYASEYLSGYVAERYSIDGRQCFVEARQEMESQLRSDAHTDILCKGYDSANVTSLQTFYQNVTYKSVLLPLYTAQYGYREKQYSYAVNGQTGKVVGGYPKSAIKITLFVLFILAILIGLFFLFGGDQEYQGDSYNYYYARAEAICYTMEETELPVYQTDVADGATIILSEES